MEVATTLKSVSNRNNQNDKLAARVRQGAGLLEAMGGLSHPNSDVAHSNLV